MTDLNNKLHTITLTDKELDMFRQWFNAVQDLNPAYLTKEDYQLVNNIYQKLGWRVPNSIKDNL